MTAPTTTGRSRLQRIARQAMTERGLQADFPAEVVAEVGAITGAPTDRGTSVRDLRDLVWASIDNDDSRDLDQLSVAAPPSGETVRISIAIADVDAAVKPGSAIDSHARHNTTSVYTAGGIFPMLPERLSTDLTSLGEDQDRLAVVIDLVVAASGEVVGSDVYRALVRNRAKLAYHSVAAWLDGAAAPPRVAQVPGLAEQLRLQDHVAQSMKGLRHRHGALELDTVKARPVFDGDTLAALRPDRQNRAEQLIEDFMIAANGVAARFLEKKRFPSLRRILRLPERWDRIAALALASGDRLPPEPDVVALQQFLSRRRKADPDRFPDLSLSVIKLLGSGEYALEIPGQPVEGHFGLAVRDYTHSTAPNRRYPDVVTQRLLKAALAGAPAPYGREELTALARHCTEQEDNAAKVERRVQKSAAALLLSSRIGERFDAIVTGAAEKGTWVRIREPVIEGKLVHGFEGLDVGDHVRVELASTDVDRGFIDFVRARESR